MDRMSGTGEVNPVAVAATVRSVITNHQRELHAAEAPAPALPAQPTNFNYTVADLFGRCFLRVCYWVDVFTSMTRRGEPLPDLAFGDQALRSLAATQSTEVLKGESAGQTIGTLPVANA